MYIPQHIKEQAIQAGAYQAAESYFPRRIGFPPEVFAIYFFDRAGLEVAHYIPRNEGINGLIAFQVMQPRRHWHSSFKEELRNMKEL